MNSPSNKQLYVWGENLFGQLGLGDDNIRPIKDPTRLNVPHSTSWAQVACSPYHTVAVSSNGEVFTCGNGFSGRLGHGDEKDRSRPTKVEIPGGENVVKVACGRVHTAAVTRTGKLFTWYVASSCYHFFYQSHEY